MIRPDTWRDVIDMWRKDAHLARALGVHRDSVAGWKKRNRIPPEHWRILLRRMIAHGMELNGDDLLKIDYRSGHLSPLERLELHDDR